MTSNSGQNGYLTGNRLIRYPFADDAIVPGLSPVRQEQVFGCFVDAMISVFSNPTDSSSQDETPRPWIRGLSSDGVTLRFSLVFGSSEIPLSCARSREIAFPVINKSTSWGYFVLVLSSDGIRELGVYAESSASSSSLSLPLSPHCVIPRADELRTIQVYDGVQTRESGPHYTLSGDIKLVPGNNIQLTSTSDNTHAIVINAVPGAGAGIIPCSCESDSSSSGNDQTSNLSCADGHVRLFNDTCYDLVPSTTEGLIYVHAKCTACCTCGMYADLVNNRLKPIYDLLAGDRSRLGQILSKYNQNVAKWNKRIQTCEPEDVVLTMAGIPLDAAGTNLDANATQVKGRLNRCGVNATIRNDSFVSITVQSFVLGGSGELRQITVNYAGSDGNPVVNQYEESDKIPAITLLPGRSVGISFFIVGKKEKTTTGETAYLANLTASVYQGSSFVTHLSKGFIA